MKGKLIVIEGNDGSGKSTQARLLAENLTKRGKDILLTHQPWKKRLRKYIRKRIEEDASPKELVRLFLIDRFIQCLVQIRPALKKGKIVILDRSKYSTEAYQVSRGFPEKKFEKMSEWVEKISGVGTADLCIILDVGAKESFRRLKKAKRKEKNIKYETSVKELEKTRNKYLKIAKKYRECVLVNGEGTIAEVYNRIWKEVKGIFKE